MIGRINLALFFSFLAFFAVAQRKSKLDTNGEGTMFVKAGYNRSVYNRPDVVLEGTDYRATLSEISLADNSEGNSMADYFDDSSPQFNFELGYFIAPKWAITIGFDRYNTFFSPVQDVVLSGTFAPGAHSSYNGSYENERITLDRSEFNLRQEQGINYFNVGVLRMDKWVKTRKATFSFNTVLGAKLGPVFSTIDYTLDNYTKQQISSFTGIGVSAVAGVRFDFFQHVFLEADVVGGFLNQKNISLSENNAEMAEQKTVFFSPQLSLGFSFFVRPTNGCGTCPQW